MNSSQEINQLICDVQSHLKFHNNLLNVTKRKLISKDMWKNRSNKYKILNSEDFITIDELAVSCWPTKKLLPLF